jgi:hypothetical protein
LDKHVKPGKQVEKEDRSDLAQPFSIGGIAAFGQSGLRRLLFTQLLVGIVCAGAVLWGFAIAWMPVLQAAIENLPAHAAISGGELAWPGPAAMVLAENQTLSIAVDLDGGGDLGAAGDLQFEFGRSELRARSLLGYVAIAYSSTGTIPLNRQQLDPWWGAWKPALLAGLFLGTFVFLMAFWSVLALGFALPVRILAFYLDRDLKGWGAWKVAGAALMPGAMMMSVAILGYAYQQITLVHLLAAAGLHLILGLFLVAISPAWLPRQDMPLGPRPRSRNPFTGRSE